MWSGVDMQLDSMKQYYDILIRYGNDILEIESGTEEAMKYNDEIKDITCCKYVMSGSTVAMELIDAMLRYTGNRESMGKVGWSEERMKIYLYTEKLKVKRDKIV